MSNPTRQHIIETTAGLLERQGYHATGLNQIVKESATPRGSLYYYFPDGKEELASEAVRFRGQQLADIIRQRLARYDDPRRAITAMIDEMAEHMAAEACSAGAPIAAAALEATTGSEQVRGACHVAYQIMRDPLIAKLTTGGFTAERAETLALTIMAAIEGAMVMGRAAGSITPLQAVSAEVRRLLDCALEG